MGKTHRLERLLENYEIHNYEPGAMLQKVRKSEAVSFNISNRQFSFQLKPRDLRSRRYRAEASLSNGEKLPVVTAPLETFEGAILGEEGAQARFTLKGDSFEGVILTRDEWYFVEPMSNFDEEAPKSEFVAYRRSDLRPEAIGICGGALSHRMSHGMELVTAPFGNESLAGYTVEIATEADFEYVTALGGASQANNEILNILNQVEGVYQADLGISFSVVYQHTWSTDADPYSSTDPNTMLQEFTDHWNNNFSSTNYDLAHMWTGRDMNGSTVGIAWKGVICFKSYSYGVSQHLTGNPAKFILTAHEMGHNFGASHPDQATTPPTDCANTIMNSSIGSGLTFCPFSRSEINVELASGASCLTGGSAGPSAPSSLSAVALSTSRINLSWQDNTSNETGFKIQRKTGAGGSYALIATTGADVTTYSDTGLASGTTYYYQVQASTSAGDTSFSNEASATTQSASTPPSISSFNPTSGPVGTRVTITGSNLAGATAVKFNNLVAGSFTADSSSQVTAYVPNGATTGLISVTTPAGTAVSASNFQVTSCTFALSSSSQSFPANGGSGTIQVISGSGCVWNAVSNSSWIILTAGSSGSGNGSVSYTIGVNSGTQSRSGSISTAGQIFLISQTGQQISCTYSFSSPGESFSAAGGNGNVSLLASGTCTWTVSSNASWITLLSGTSGSGNSSVNYQVAANTSASGRSGTLTAAGQSYTVTQSAPATGSDTATVFLPIILSSSGVGGTYYTTEMALTNRGASNANLEFIYTSSIGSGSGTGRASLGAGKQILIADAISYLRSAGIPIPLVGNVGGTLQIKFSGLSTPSDGAATVRIGTAVQGGKAGLAYNGISLSAALNEAAYLFGLRQNAADRSNLALQNAGTEGSGDISLRITLYSGARNNPTAHVLPIETLSPGGFRQISGVLYSNGLHLSGGYAKVERIAGSAPFFAYGVINDQFTSDGSFIAPLAESSLAGKNRLVLPVLVETISFTSELIAANWSPLAKTLRCRFVADGIQTGDSAATFNLELQAGEQLIIPEFVDWLRRQGVNGIGTKGLSYVGPLFVESTDLELGGVAILARTSSQGGGGRYGLFYGSLSNGTAPTTSAWIFGLQQTTQSRSNLALVNTGETDAGNNSFRIEIFDGLTGAKVATINSITLKAKGWMQISSILAQYAPSVSQGFVRITRTSGNNPFIPYAVINDGSSPGQGTGDGAYLPNAP